jgi:hypothetical protein
MNTASNLLGSAADRGGNVLLLALGLATALAVVVV